jgi:hypothetical protein
MTCFIDSENSKIHLMTSSYEGLLKDKAIINAEVLHEYDEKVCRRF